MPGLLVAALLLWLPALEHRLLSMWDLLRSGIRRASPALAGSFFTIELPEKPIIYLFLRSASLGYNSHTVEYS